MDICQKFISTSESHNSPVECREKRLLLDGNRGDISVGPTETAGFTNSVTQSNLSQIVLGIGYGIINVHDSKEVNSYSKECISMAHISKTSSNSSDSVKNLAHKNMKSKVDSFTQVETNFENELCRNIVGQERIQDIQVVGTSSDSIQRENRKYVRPPLVGQASSSSNESGSVPIGRRRSASSELDNSYDEHDISPPSRLLDRYRETCPTDGGTYYTGISVRNFNVQPNCLTNRDDYINERPPEGSDQFIVNVGPVDQPDSQRIPSPSSVSSVNSARPLEWDSGADVGYYQNYVADNQAFDPGLSTIERIALVRGTAALLTRSDPEGTTGPSGQMPLVQPGKVGIKAKNSKGFIGIPQGESTPVTFLQNKSSSTSAESETEISPIINENNAGKNPVNVPSVNSKHSDDFGLMTKSNENKKSQKKYPLFPEVVLSKLQGTKKNMHKNMTGAELPDVNNVDIQHSGNPGNVEINDKRDVRSENKIEPHFYENNTFVDNNMVNLGAAKKLSSSLENIRDLNKLSGLDDNIPHVSRPRSRSQTNLFTYPPDSTKSDENFSRPMVFNYPKSGSSSSIATVVQKKRDSPKHLSKLVQTSSLMKHSTGIQACEVDRVQNGMSMSNLTTPHIPSREFKGNFKDLLDKEELNASEAQRRQIESKLFPSSEVQNDLPQDNILQDNHYHDGVLCTGAHKKTYQVSHEAQQSMAPVRTAILEAAYKKDSIDIKKIDDRCNSTLESVESSAKSQGGYFFERQSSVTVEDRVNSFEYLPGDIYENASRQAGTISDVASSESARIEVNENKDRLWDSSASSTLVRDVRRGVDIMMDFIKSSHATDKQLKHKLIRRVVQKLINSDYASDRQDERLSLERNVPWVPPVIQTKPTSTGRETKPFTRAQVPGECTSSSMTTTDRSSSRTSSECFKPQLKKDISIPKTTAVAEKCVGTVSACTVTNLRTFKLSGHSLVSPTPTSSSNQNVSATPYVTSDSTSTQYDIRQRTSSKQPSHITETNLNSLRRGRIAAGANDTTTTSDTIHSTSSQADWRQPVTKTEKLYEQRRKQQAERQSKGPSSEVLHYLDMERKNQLFWIRSEIQHLNNLKTLLEKQEELKENIKEIRKSKYRNYTIGSDKKDNEKHHKRGVTTSGSSANYKDSSLGMIASPKKKTLNNNNYHQNGPSTLRSWLLKQQHRSESSEESHHNNPNLYKIDSHRQVRKSGKEWTSHENLLRVREEETKKDYKTHGADAVNRAASSLKTKENKSILKSRNAVVDAAVESSEELRERPQIIQGPPQRSLHTKDDDRKTCAKNYYTDGVLKKSEETVKESLQHSQDLHDEYEGKAAQRKLQKGKQIRCPCERDGHVCKCCKERKFSGEDCTKQPVGYYITFEQSPIRVPKKKQPQPVQKERAEVASPYSEPVVRQPTNSAAEQEVIQAKKLVPSRDQKQVRISSSDTDSQSKEENDSGGNQRNPTLQDYLVTNRPDYVSRAEDRRQCVAELVYLRELRDKSKRRLLELTDSGPTARELPPPPLAVKRVFSQRTMRRQTEKKYRQLSEVQGKQQDMKRKQAYRTNRLMAQVYTKKLQRRVLKGEVNLSNSVSVISNI